MPSFRDLALLSARGVLGGYLAVHGAQKLFGAFGGRGIDATAASFDRIGLRPGQVTARVAGTSELAGGILTAAGAAHPVGPVTLAATMAVASSTHRANGALAAQGGFELPLTNMAAALALAVTGPGRLSVDRALGTTVPRSLARLVVAGAAVASGATLAMVLRTPPPVPSAPPAGPTPPAGTNPPTDTKPPVTPTPPAGTAETES